MCISSVRKGTNGVSLSDDERIARKMIKEGYMGLAKRMKIVIGWYGTESDYEEDAHRLALEPLHLVQKHAETSSIQFLKFRLNNCSRDYVPDDSSEKALKVFVDVLEKCPNVDRTWIDCQSLTYNLNIFSMNIFCGSRFEEFT